MAPKYFARLKCPRCEITSTIKINNPYFVNSQLVKGSFVCPKCGAETFDATFPTVYAAITSKNLAHDKYLAKLYEAYLMDDTLASLYESLYQLEENCLSSMYIRGDEAVRVYPPDVVENRNKILNHIKEYTKLNYSDLVFVHSN